MLKAPCVQDLELELGCYLWADVDSWPCRWSALNTPTLDPRTSPAGSDLPMSEEQIEGADWDQWGWAKWEWGRRGRAHLTEQQGGIIPWQYFKIHFSLRVLLI